MGEFLHPSERDFVESHQKIGGNVEDLQAAIELCRTICHRFDIGCKHCQEIVLRVVEFRRVGRKL